MRRVTHSLRKATPLHRIGRALPQHAVETVEQNEAVSETPFEEGVHDMLDPDLRHRMISEAAFRLYAQRGYTDGYDLDDWLQAEAEVDHTTLERFPDDGTTDEEPAQTIGLQASS